jgi:hypothetical protein
MSAAEQKGVVAPEQPCFRRDVIDDLLARHFECPG